MSDLITSLSSGQRISFTLVTNLITSEYNDVIVEAAMVSHGIAMTYTDVDAIHNNIYSSMSDVLPKNANGYSYLLVRLTTGELVAVGYPWIKLPFVVVSTKTAVITVNNLQVDDVPYISKALNAYGITNFTVEVN